MRWRRREGRTGRMCVFDMIQMCGCPRLKVKAGSEGEGQEWIYWSYYTLQNGQTTCQMWRGNESRVSGAGVWRGRGRGARGRGGDGVLEVVGLEVCSVRSTRGRNVVRTCGESRRNGHDKQYRVEGCWRYKYTNISSIARYSPSRHPHQRHRFIAVHRSPQALGSDVALVP